MIALKHKHKNGRWAIIITHPVLSPIRSVVGKYDLGGELVSTTENEAYGATVKLATQNPVYEEIRRSVHETL